MGKEYILTIDQGTTSTRAIIFDNKANVIAENQIEFSQICPIIHVNGYIGITMLLRGYKKWQLF